METKINRRTVRNVDFMRLALHNSERNLDDNSDIEEEEKKSQDLILVYRPNESQYAHDFAMHIQLKNPDNIRSMTVYEQKNKWPNYSYVTLRPNGDETNHYTINQGKMFRKTETTVRKEFTKFLQSLFRKYANMLQFNNSQFIQMIRWINPSVCNKPSKRLNKYLDDLKLLMSSDLLNDENDGRVNTLNYKLNIYFQRVQNVHPCVTSLIFLIQCLFSTCIHVALLDSEVNQYNVDGSLVTVWINGDAPGYIKMSRGNTSYALNIYRPNKKCYFLQDNQVYHHINTLVPFQATSYAPAWVRWNTFLLFQGGVCRPNAKYLVESKIRSTSQLNRFFNGRNVQSEQKLYQIIKSYELYFIVLGNDQFNQEPDAKELLAYLKSANIQEYALTTLPQLEMLEKATLFGDASMIRYLINQRVQDGFEPSYGFERLSMYQQIMEMAEFTYTQHKSKRLRTQAERAQVMALVEIPKYFPVLKQMAIKKFRNRKRFNWKTKTRNEILALLLDTDQNFDQKKNVKVFINDIVDVPAEFTDQKTGKFNVTTANENVLQRKWLLQHYGIYPEDIDQTNIDEIRTPPKRDLWSLWKHYRQGTDRKEIVSEFKEHFSSFSNYYNNISISEDSAFMMIWEVINAICMSTAELDSPTALFLSSLHKVQSVLFQQTNARAGATDTQEDLKVDNRSANTRRQILQEFVQIKDYLCQNTDNAEPEVKQVRQTIRTYQPDFKSGIMSTHIFRTFGDYRLEDLSLLINNLRSFPDPKQQMLAWTTFIIHMMVSYDILDIEMWRPSD